MTYLCTAGRALALDPAGDQTKSDGNKQATDDERHIITSSLVSGVRFAKLPRGSLRSFFTWRKNGDDHNSGPTDGGNCDCRRPAIEAHIQVSVLGEHR